MRAGICGEGTAGGAGKSLLRIAGDDHGIPFVRVTGKNSQVYGGSAAVVSPPRRVGFAGIPAAGPDVLPFLDEIPKL